MPNLPITGGAPRAFVEQVVDAYRGHRTALPTAAADPDDPGPALATASTGDETAAAPVATDELLSVVLFRVQKEQRFAAARAAYQSAMRRGRVPRDEQLALLRAMVHERTLLTAARQALNDAVAQAARAGVQAA